MLLYCRACELVYCLYCGRVPQEDADTWQVYGCYCAVSLADARALQALRASLPALLSDRHWQQGAYTCEVRRSECDF